MTHDLFLGYGLSVVSDILLLEPHMVEIVHLQSGKKGLVSNRRSPSLVSSERDEFQTHSTPVSSVHLVITMYT